MNTGRYSVHTLFSSSEIEQIIIPEIQRDYVWQEKNVKGLINSILSHFREKQSLSLKIMDSKRLVPVSQDIHSFLSEEYTRMVHSTRIGFIYAYHSQDYPGKYFLIDGQQRITTIFLLLLCAYKKAGLSNDYRKKYFTSKLPKIDYKVREISHDFLVDFIDFETLAGSNDKKEPFRESKYFYHYYDQDVTISNMLCNYAYIEEIIESYRPTDVREEDFYKDLLHYVENYIEFNYFDTNICEQGERLYLYMNSRGEELSVQESIRPTLIARSTKKLVAGEQWETWQNYFWKQKGDNPNADKGFQEFLRWATFLHIICGTNNPILYNRKNNNETKQDYIRIEKKDGNRSEQQQRWIREYQEENKDFTIDYIGKVFDAVSRLETIIKDEKGRYINSHWLSYIDKTNDYPTLLACLAYLLFYPDADAIEVKRVGMFVKNCMYYDTNNKNPEMASVNIVNAVKTMKENGIRDIVNLHKISNLVAKNIFIEADLCKTACALTMSRSEWEELFWQITDDNTFSTFLEGDTTCLFEWAGFRREKFIHYYMELKCRIIEVVNRNDKDENIRLHEKLLEYGDFAARKGTGIGIQRYYLIKYPEEWTWGINENAHIRDILKMYLDNEEPKRLGELYRLLIDESAHPRSVLGYTEYLELLKSDDNPPHIILPRIYQVSGDNYRELMTQWVHQAVKQSKVYSTNYVVLEFDIDSETGHIMLDNIKDVYYLNMVYHWNSGHPFWSFKIGTRGKEFHKNISNIISKWCLEPYKWEEIYNDKKQHNEYSLENPLYDNPNETIHQRKQLVLDFIDEIWKCLSMTHNRNSTFNETR